MNKILITIGLMPFIWFLIFQIIPYPDNVTERVKSIDRKDAAELNAVVTYLKSQIPEKKEEEIKPQERIDYCG